MNGITTDFPRLAPAISAASSRGKCDEPWLAVSRVPEFLPSAGRIVGLLSTVFAPKVAVPSRKFEVQRRPRSSRWIFAIQNEPVTTLRGQANVDLMFQGWKSGAGLLVEFKYYSPAISSLKQFGTMHLSEQFLDAPAPHRQQALVEEFHLLRQMTGRVREVGEEEFSAIFAATNADEAKHPDCPEEDELVARFRIRDVLDDRQRSELAPGMVFDLVTGRRVSIDPATGGVVRSKLETSLFLRHPRPLSPTRVHAAISRADAAFAASEG